ncbi:hypothetical protein [Streptomyces sp. NPDC050704]|uniref:hypothetical protein n=1 Tax=Streptomyces sp. NPDC050704 TaxID=3157219 RepID=UPI003449C66D
MDSNAALARLRRVVDGLESVAANSAEDWSGELIDVLEHVAAQDEWLCGGGFLPQGWTQSSGRVELTR